MLETTRPLRLFAMNKRSGFSCVLSQPQNRSPRHRSVGVGDIDQSESPTPI
ncbi:MAG: hypothetical protein K2O61_00990 [Bacteroidaceae bacterium]|nr:hypothetical protein [Bacteroidaceae bacterium]